MRTMQILSIDEIVSDPNVRGGRPTINGTHIAVVDLVYQHIAGDQLSLETLAEHFGLPLGQVYAAITYYYLHQDEIETQRALDEKTLYENLEILRAQGKVIE